MKASAVPISSPDEVRRQIRYRLIGAKYECGQAVRDALDTNLTTSWRTEVTLAENALARALAMMER